MRLRRLENGNFHSGFCFGALAINSQQECIFNEANPVFTWKAQKIYFGITETHWSWLFWVQGLLLNKKNRNSRELQTRQAVALKTDHFSFRQAWLASCGTRNCQALKIRERFFLFANALRRLTNCVRGINRLRSIIHGVYRRWLLAVNFLEVHNNLRVDASLVGHFESKHQCERKWMPRTYHLLHYGLKPENLDKRRIVK